MLVVFPQAASAQEDELDQGKVFAIQERAFRMNHEFSLSTSFLPLDAFYKFVAVAGHYTVHFDDFWAWEAIHFSFTKYLDLDTGLKKEMADRWDVSPTDTHRMDFFLDTNLMLKPFYGKMALFDDAIVHMETYIVLGLGTLRSEAPVPYPVSVNVGVGMRIFLSNTLSLRFEAREYTVFFIDTGGIEHVLSLGVAFSYNAFADEVAVGEVPR
jgi:outer membrane beta-barrel protein